MDTFATFYNCSLDHSNHQGDVRIIPYLADREIDTLFGSETEQVLVRLCEHCSDAVCVKLKLSDLKEAIQCIKECGHWFVADSDTLPYSCGMCDECCNDARECVICDSCGLHTDSLCEHCNHCSDNECCECRICTHWSCTRLVECSNEDCDRCERHCNCITCSNCGTTESNLSICENGDCDDCCSCDHNDDDDSEIREGRPWKALTPKEHKGFRSTRLVGVEWEFNKCTRSDVEHWAHNWRGGIHYDGSCGWEAVTAPLAGDYIAQCLTDLGKAFADGGAEADTKCGIHVHVDAADLQWADMYRLLWVYQHIEPFLFLLGGQNRIDSTYAAPCGKRYKAALGRSLLINKAPKRLNGKTIKELPTWDVKNKVLSVALDRDGRSSIKRNRPIKKESGRYKALNICPWIAGKWQRPNKASDTTIEFRLHMHSLDSKRVIGWTQLMASLVDYAVRATDKEVEALPRSSLRALCEVIAPTSREWILSRVKAYRQYHSHYSGRARRIRLKDGRYQF